MTNKKKCPFCGTILDRTGRYEYCDGCEKYPIVELDKSQEARLFPNSKKKYRSKYLKKELKEND